MELSFNVELAELAGLDEAVFVHSIGFWLRKNKANRANFTDGRYWTYNTRQALAELFPFWTPRQIDRIVESCQNKGLLLVAHPEGKTARTWYSLTPEAENYLDLDLSPNGDKLSRNGDNLSPNGDKLSRNGDNALNLKNTKKEQNKTKESARKVSEKVLLEVVGSDPELQKLVIAFIDVRWKIGKPFKSSNGPTAAAGRLKQYSAGQPWKMRKIIQQTLDNEWLTFYALKGDDEATQRGAPPQAPRPIKEASAWR